MSFDAEVGASSFCMSAFFWSCRLRFWRGRLPVFFFSRSFRTFSVQLVNQFFAVVNHLQNRWKNNSIGWTGDSAEIAIGTHTHNPRYAYPVLFLFAPLLFPPFWISHWWCCSDNSSYRYRRQAGMFVILVMRHNQFCPPAVWNNKRFPCFRDTAWWLFFVHNSFQVTVSPIRSDLTVCKCLIYFKMNSIFLVFCCLLTSC